MTRRRTNSRSSGPRAAALLISIASIAGGLLLLFAVGLGLPDARETSTKRESKAALASAADSEPVELDRVAPERTSEAPGGAATIQEAGARTLSGRVVCAEGPLDGADVLLVITERDGGDRTRARTRAGAEGEFEFVGVPADANCLVQASHPGYVPRPERIELGHAGAIVLLLEADAKPRVRVSGEVVLPDGTPGVGATVTFGKQSARTNARGEYAMELVDHGTPETAITAALEGRLPGSIEGFGARVASIQPQSPGEAAPARSIAGVRLVLGEVGLTIEGRVVDGEGKPAKGWRVAAGEPARRTEGVRTDEAGRFVVAGLAPGAHVLRAWNRDPSRAVVTEPIEAGARAVEIATQR